VPAFQLSAGAVWRGYGVKVVYAAAWAADYRKWDFNYNISLILSQNGILVYAWF